MRLKITKTNSAITYYIIRDVKNKNGKRSTKIYKRLGNETEISKLSDGESAYSWAKKASGN